jgi:hypothetical protein
VKDYFLNTQPVSKKNSPSELNFPDKEKPNKATVDQLVRNLEGKVLISKEFLFELEANEVNSTQRIDFYKMCRQTIEAEIYIFGEETAKKMWKVPGYPNVSIYASVMFTLLHKNFDQDIFSSNQLSRAFADIDDNPNSPFCLKLSDGDPIYILGDKSHENPEWIDIYKDIATYKDNEAARPDEQQNLAHTSVVENDNLNHIYTASNRWIKCAIFTACLALMIIIGAAIMYNLAAVQKLWTGSEYQKNELVGQRMVF